MKYFITLLLIVLPFVSTFAQSKWKRKAESKELPLRLFNSAEVLNLKSAETVPKGDIYYGISHRFNGNASGGMDNFFGLDNGAVMRTKLGYAPFDGFMFAIGRSSQNKQYDIEMKYRFFRMKNEYFPVMLAFNAGYAYSDGDYFEDKSLDIDIDRNQYHGSLIINTMYKELFGTEMAIGFGLTPTYLHNSLVGQFENQYSVTMGYYVQLYLGNDITSLIFEGNPTVYGWRSQEDGTKAFDTYAFGLELETGGHFFKLLLTNNTMINTSQFNAGSTDSFEWNNLHIGFQITRNFSLKM